MRVVSRRGNWAAAAGRWRAEGRDQNHQLHDTRSHSGESPTPALDFPRGAAASTASDSPPVDVQTLLGHGNSVNELKVRLCARARCQLPPPRDSVHSLAPSLPPSLPARLQVRLSSHPAVTLNPRPRPPHPPPPKLSPTPPPRPRPPQPPTATAVTATAAATPAAVMLPPPVRCTDRPPAPLPRSNPHP
jgi:hypothetical protein